MSLLIIVLGGYMLLMGLIGYFRTKSLTALYVNGGIAIITMVLGFLVGDQRGMILTLALGWLTLVTIMLSVLTIKRLRNRQSARPGSIFIFGSMALFALIVLIAVLIRSRS